MRSRALIVLKFGSSVLRNEKDLGRAVGEIARWIDRGRRVIAVVSAFKGRTDELLGRAERYRRRDGTTNEHALAALVGIGETESAALLTLALHHAGHRVTMIDAEAMGLRTQGPPLDSMPVSIDASRLRKVLDTAEVAVVPGFVGRDASGNPTLLGRGGSDLTALFVAFSTGSACRLIKDVAGVFGGDPSECAPASDRPRVYESLHWDDARAMNGRVIQGRAASFAFDRRVPFEVGGLGRDDPTAIGSEPTRLRRRPGRDSPEVKTQAPLAVCCRA